MSHVAKVDVELKDINAIIATCKRLGAEYCGKGFIKFYDGNEVGGHVIQFQGWQYPVVIQPDGTVVYDNYEGEWGNIEQLERFKQYYAVETAKIAAEAEGYTYQEETLPTGVLKLTINI